MITNLQHQANLFYYILERDGKVKSLSLYQGSSWDNIRFVYNLTTKEMVGLKINNIPENRHVAVFDKNTVCARYRNHKCKTKRTRNNVFLHGSFFENSRNHQLNKL